MQLNTGLKIVSSWHDLERRLYEDVLVRRPSRSPRKSDVLEVFAGEAQITMRASNFGLRACELIDQVYDNYDLKKPKDVASLLDVIDDHDAFVSVAGKDEHNALELNLVVETWILHLEASRTKPRSLYREKEMPTQFLPNKGIDRSLNWTS